MIIKQGSSSWNCLFCLGKTRNVTTLFKQTYLLRYCSLFEGHTKEVEHNDMPEGWTTKRIRNCFFLVGRKEEQWMGWKTAGEIIKSALIISVFSKPHGRFKCHCWEVHFELHVSVCLWISLLVLVPPQFAS